MSSAADIPALFRQHRYAECENLCRSVLMADKANFTVRSALINALAAQGKMDAAINECGLGRELHGAPEEQAALLHLQAMLQARSGQLDAAVSSLQDCVSANPARVDSWLLLMRMLYDLNRFEACGRAASKLLKKGAGLNDAGIGVTTWYLVQCDPAMTASRFARKFPKMKRDVDAAEFHFAMGELYERERQYKTALMHYDQANSRQRQQSGYQLGSAIDLIRRYRELLTVDTPGSVKADAGPAPVFILGMPRTGSSLLEQMLSRHSQVTACGEVPWLRDAFQAALGDSRSDQDMPLLESLCTDEEFLQQVRNSYLSHVGTVETPFITDKLPGNFLYLFLIRLVFPDALVIHMHREREATVWSCYKTHFLLGNGFTQSIEDASQCYDEVEVTMKAAEQVLGDRYLKVTYERLVTDPRGELSNVFSSLGLELEEACLEHNKSDRIVVTSSRHQVLRDIYADANRGWKPFEKLIRERLS